MDRPMAFHGPQHPHLDVRYLQSAHKLTSECAAACDAGLSCYLYESVSYVVGADIVRIVLGSMPLIASRTMNVARR